MVDSDALGPEVEVEVPECPDEAVSDPPPSSFHDVERLYGAMRNTPAHRGMSRAGSIDAVRRGSSAAALPRAVAHQSRDPYGDGGAVVPRDDRSLSALSPSEQIAALERAISLPPIRR